LRGKFRRSASLTATVIPNFLHNSVISNKKKMSLSKGSTRFNYGRIVSNLNRDRKGTPLKAHAVLSFAATVQ